MLNKLLIRQIQKCLGNTDALPAGLDKLLQVVSDSYDHYEKDRKMLERSIELTSNELIELNEQLRRETAEGSRAVLARLKESLSLPEGGDDEPAGQEADFGRLLKIADALKEETQKRRLAEKELKKREGHLSSSQRIAHIGSWELDLENLDELNNNELYWSEETFRIFGFEPGAVKVTNELFFNCVHPDDRARVQEAVAASLHTGQLYDLDHKLLLKDGTEKIVREIGQIIISTATGKPRKIIGTVQDITERVKARESLQNANAALRTLFENITEVFFSVDMLRYQTLQISPACEEVYGFSVEDFKQHSNLWYDRILDEDKEIIHGNEARMRSGQAIDQEYRIRHKNGTIRWLQTRIRPTLDKDGQLIRIDGISIDTTDRKNAELALKASEHRLRSLIENSADAFMIMDEHGAPSFASNSLYRIMGYSAEEILGVPTYRYIHPEDKDTIKAHLHRVLQHPGVPSPIVYRRMKKDGSYIWCEGVATNLLHDPVINGIVVNFRDITERHDYELALKASNDSLRKTNHELDKFVYSVSHDLRAPLSSMLGVVEFASTETEDPDLLEHLSMLRKSITRLDGFILDILNYSRNTRMEVAHEPFSLKELLGEIIDHVQYMDAGNQKINIDMMVEQDHISSDRSRWSIILSNLISNAIRYADPYEENPYVHIRATPAENGVQVSVKDNGIGIPADKQTRIFEMFYRAAKSSEGSGIGLYLVKETVEKLEGTISLTSSPGEGSEFIIYIPHSKH